MAKQACRENFLSFPRMREWRDVHEQLAQHARGAGWPESSVRCRASRKATARSIARCSPGLLGNVGMRDDRRRATPARAASSSGSIRARGRRSRAAGWSAAELVETTRLFARAVAAIEPRWLEEVGGHLIKREHYEPHWDARRGEVVALERGTLYGLPVYANRRVALRTDRRAGGARDLHPRGAGARASSTRARRSSRTTGAWSPRSSASSTSRGGRTSWSTRS